ncbi:MAG: hypothetical protein A2474_06130 [Elusimicrobia bacterium RIFOXYC2_FULL_34_12]|nr:MAG: hypothetical protein A2474_06130 [Elusimicrobia bacterium RIFOXYC2_FULL_34_12]HAM38873.1 hypothetical protein [Elusimicrobiota bacterium]
MKHFLSIILLLIFNQTCYAITAEEIVKSVDSNLTFNEGEMNINIIDIKSEKVTKTLLANVKFKKDKGTLIEFLEPAREKNKRILMVKDNMWMFVPGISRPIRLSGKDSFMGTSFSNRDLMDYDMNNDYKSSIIETTDEKYRLELKATNKNVTYPKVIMDVEKERLLPVYQELYTVSENLIKTIDYSDIKDLGGKLRPSVMVIKDVLTQGNETKVIIKNMIDKNINENIFSPQNIVR